MAATVPPAALPAQARRQLIAERIALDGFVSVAALAAELAVSEVTVRTDLDGLERAGALRRVHGGALPSSGSVRESSVETTAELDADVKRRIGRKAAGLVADGSSLLLDVGSTTLAVARALVARSDLTDVVVITNGLSIALALEPAIPRFTVVVTGGTLRPAAALARQPDGVGGARRAARRLRDHRLHGHRRRRQRDEREPARSRGEARDDGRRRASAFWSPTPRRSVVVTSDWSAP